MVIEDMIDSIVFVPDPAWRSITEPEIYACREELAGSGISIRVSAALIESPERNTLYLSDSPAYYEHMRSQGVPVAGYIHEGSGNAQFPHCPYLVSEPQWVDTDSYTKIYERLTGQPWTILTTERLVIREMTVDDLDDLYALYDAQARQFMTPPGEDRDAERILLSNYIEQIYGMFGYGYWAVTLRGSRRMIGRIGFAAYEGAGDRISFGYIMHPAYRRQGYALEAAGAILAYAQEVLELPGISAEVRVGNTASIRFLKRLGFRKENSIDVREIYVL